MGDFGVKKNGSGYVDPVAYEAITKVDRENTPKAGEIWSFRKSNSLETCEVLVVKNHGPLISGLMLVDRELHGTYPVLSRSMMFSNPCNLTYFLPSRLGEFIKALPDVDFVEWKKKIAEVLGLPMYEIQNVSSSVDYLDELEKKVEALEAEKASAEEALKAANEQYSVLSQECEELRSSNSETADEVEYLRDKLSDSEKALADIRTKAEGLQESLDFTAKTNVHLVKENNRLSLQAAAGDGVYKKLYDELLDRVLGRKVG